MKRTLKFFLFALVLISFLPAYATPTDKQNIVPGLNSFSFALYLQLALPSKNMLVSPYSVAAPLSILALGAQGDTRSQLDKTLKITADNQVLVTGIRNISLSLAQQKPCDDNLKCASNRFLQQLKLQTKPLLIANALWAQENLPYQSSFLNEIKLIPDTYFNKVDYTQNSEFITSTINHWVARKTADHIQQLIPAGMLNEQTRLVITNATYFKDAWKEPFKKDQTQTRTFILLNGRKINIPMMQDQRSLDYTENNLLQLVQLPYQNTHLAMAVLLPKPNHSLREIKNYLNNNSFTQLLNKSHKVEVNIQLPKFTIKSTHFLKDALVNMGMPILFTDKANFSGITSVPLSVNGVIQKAGIEVDEAGTTAYAATAVMMFGTALLETKQFFANHPFIFIIYDKTSGIILFIGQLINPDAN